MTTLAQRVEAVHRFSGLYTDGIGLLSGGRPRQLSSSAEARIIAELVRHDTSTATEVARALGLDLGYVSRLVSSLEQAGLVTKEQSETDRRRQILSLSQAGTTISREVDSESRREIAEELSQLTVADQKRMVKAMRVIEEILDRPRSDRRAVNFRPHRPGDMGWIVQRHGEIYQASHGWNANFEAMVAKISAEFLEKYDPSFERSWIAEVDGERAGAVLLVRRSKTVGQLRLLFVDPAARGLGVGTRLVSECVGHARHVGYRKMILFTARGLSAARRLYEAEGFQLTEEAVSRPWGQEYVMQTWELKL